MYKSDMAKQSNADAKVLRFRCKLKISEISNYVRFC